jgi:hypothetical protein
MAMVDGLKTDHFRVLKATSKESKHYSSVLKLQSN